MAENRGGELDHHLIRGHERSMTTLSRLPRKQRRAIFVAHTAERRRRMAVLLSRELRARYGRRQIPIRKGDTARVIRGSYIGREERVAKVDRRRYAITLDNITVKTGEAKLKPLPIRTSHLVLTRLNLADAWRRRVLKVPEGTESETEAAVPEAVPTEPMEEPTRSAEPKKDGEKTEQEKKPEATAPKKPRRTSKKPKPEAE